MPTTPWPDADLTDLGLGPADQDLTALDRTGLGDQLAHATTALAFLDWKRFQLALAVYRTIAAAVAESGVDGAQKVLDVDSQVTLNLAQHINGTEYQAGILLDDAFAARDRLPRCARLLKNGVIDRRRFHLIVVATELIIDPVKLALIDQLIAAELAGVHARGAVLSEKQTTALADRHTATIDPDAVRRRREDAKARRTVYITPREHGMSALTVVATAEDNRLLLAAVDAFIAGLCPHDPRTLGAKRADALNARITGKPFTCQCEREDCTATLDPTAVDERLSRVVIHVLCDRTTLDGGNKPAYLDGHGVISADHARDLAHRDDALIREHDLDDLCHHPEPGAPEDPADPVDPTDPATDGPASAAPDPADSEPAAKPADPEADGSSVVGSEPEHREPAEGPAADVPAADAPAAEDPAADDRTSVMPAPEDRAPNDITVADRTSVSPGTDTEPDAEADTGAGAGRNAPGRWAVPRNSAWFLFAPHNFVSCAHRNLHLFSHTEPAEPRQRSRPASPAPSGDDPARRVLIEAGLPVFGGRPPLELQPFALSDSAVEAAFAQIVADYHDLPFLTADELAAAEADMKADAERVSGGIIVNTALPSDPYRPNALTAMVVRFLWGTCSIPGCHRAAYSCDLDHTEEFDQICPQAGGPTCLCNLLPKCRRHHLMKTCLENFVDELWIDGTGLYHSAMTFYGTTTETLASNQWLLSRLTSMRCRHQIAKTEDDAADNGSTEHTVTRASRAAPGSYAASPERTRTRTQAKHARRRALRAANRRARRGQSNAGGRSTADTAAELVADDDKPPF
ncbi:MAG: DUF222 domain-containing protein [Gordonia sp. (in: high G+C Gram-positive bacteria)]